MRTLSYIIWIIVIISILLYANRTYAFQAGVITDAHLGSKSKRKSGQSIVYPKQALKYFERAVKEMQQQGVDVIISLGDNTQDGGKKYYKGLKKIEAKYGIKVLWVHGNHAHDRDDTLAKRNYIYDLKGTRFIVLDTNENCAKHQKNAGCLDQSQVDFIHQNQTGNDILLQHIPPLMENTCDMRMDFIAEEDMRVLSGHFHKEMDCGNVRVFKPLTEHKKLQYKIIDL